MPKIRLKAIEDSLSNKEESIMHETEEDVIKIQNTQGATSLRETKGVILEKLSGEVINVIMIFSIIVDNKKSLNVFFMVDLIEILSFKKHYFT